MATATVSPLRRRLFRLGVTLLGLVHVVILARLCTWLATELEITGDEEVHRIQPPSSRRQTSSTHLSLTLTQEQLERAKWKWERDKKKEENVQHQNNNKTLSGFLGSVMAKKKKDTTTTSTEEPIILGLETCRAYRDAVPPTNRIVAPAGNFNTETNMFPRFFSSHCTGVTSLQQVPWGKHNLGVARLEQYRTQTKEHQDIVFDHVLPIIMARHPLSWMFATCQHNSASTWNHTQENCPHLVQDHVAEASKYGPRALHTVHVDYGYKGHRNGHKYYQHPSLIHFWKEWMESYYTKDKFPFPRLIVRLQDIRNHPSKVLAKICDCVGGTQALEGKSALPAAEGRNATSPSLANLWQQMSARDQQVFHQVALTEDKQGLMERLQYSVEGEAFPIKYPTTYYKKFKERNQQEKANLTRLPPHHVSLLKLREQGIEVPEEEWDEIPAWSNITASFGEEPIVLGLESCEAYRQAVPMKNRSVAPAGNFNTGTNLFSVFFGRNCQGLAEKPLLQVPWGKHNMAVARHDNYQINKTRYLAVPNEYVLPVVLVRHPISWMFSTCKNSYAAHWNHTKENCPHLVHDGTPYSKHYHPASLYGVHVAYGYKRTKRKYFRHTSLIHFWKEWIDSFITDFPFPRLIVRLEDIVYQPLKVLTKICECAGGVQRPGGKISMPEESVKVKRDRLRNKTGLPGALVRGNNSDTAGLLKGWKDHAKIPALWERMSAADQQVVKQVFNEDFELLELLQYKIEGM